MDGSEGGRGDADKAAELIGARSRGAGGRWLPAEEGPGRVADDCDRPLLGPVRLPVVAVTALPTLRKRFFFEVDACTAPYLISHCWRICGGTSDG